MSTHIEEGKEWRGAGYPHNKYQALLGASKQNLQIPQGPGRRARKHTLNMSALIPNTMPGALLTNKTWFESQLWLHFLGGPTMNSLPEDLEMRQRALRKTADPI